MDPRFRRLATLTGAAAMLLVLAGNVAAASPAKLQPAVSTDSTATVPAGNAWIRVLHASPDAPAVDVYVDGAKAISGLAFGQIAPTTAPGYAQVAAGDHAIKVCATGSTTVCPIDVPKLNLADGHKYTIAATNLLAKIEAQVLDDTAAAVAGSAQVRVVHFSADTPAVDVYLDGTKTAITGLAYPKATDYVALPGKDYAVKVCATGSTTVCPIDVAKLTLANGTAYSVYAIGSLNALLATPQPGLTPPPTDTATSATGTTGTSFSLALAALVLVGLGSLGFTLRFVTRRSHS